MKPAFNVHEIFDIAEQIERNGAAFYRAAAGGKTGKACQALFLDLAAQEDEHLRTFIDLRKRTAAQPIEQPEGDLDATAVLYLQAIAGGYVFEMSESPKAALSGHETLIGIMKYAIRKEEDSIVLYLGMKEVLQRSEDRDVIQKIIREEQKHLIDLASQIGLLRA